MDITLHLGAHRTATANFQNYMARNADTLSARGVAFWGPERTRTGLFTGLTGAPRALSPRRVSGADRGTGLIRLESARLEAAGVHQLIISDQDLIGSVSDNLRKEELYPDVAARLSRFRAGLAARCTRIVLLIRNYDSYWASAASLGIACGFALPDTDTLDRLTTQPRRWRAVIQDIAVVFPAADLLVLPFARFAGLPDSLCGVMTEGHIDAPVSQHKDWPHRGRNPERIIEALRARGIDPSTVDIPLKDGVWTPFDVDQTEMLRAVFAEDLAWLRSGADGLARLIEKPQSGWTTHEDMGKLARAMKPNRERPDALPKIQRQMG